MALRLQLLILTLFVLGLPGTAYPDPLGKANSLAYVESATAVVSEVWVEREKGMGFEEHLLEVPREIQLHPVSDDVADLLVDLGLPPGVYERVRLIITSGRVDLNDEAHVSDTYSFTTARGNLSFPSSAQSGNKMTIEAPIRVVTRLSDELDLELDLSRSFVFNGSPTHAPGVKGVVFTPVTSVANTSTHGRISLRVIENVQGSTCAPPVATPIAGAIVAVIDPSRAALPETTYTDVAGNAWLPLLPGVYDLVIAKPGFKPVRLEGHEVYLANETALGDVVLHRAFVSVAFDKERAFLLSLLMNLGYEDWSGYTRGQQLPNPKDLNNPPLQTDPAEYLNPCWRYYASIDFAADDDPPVGELVPQLFIGYNKNNGDIVVSFAGTADSLDIVADVNAIKVSWTLPNGDVIDKAVHAGFKLHYFTVRPLLKLILDQAIRDHAEAGSRIYITGHSLGGSLAILAALDLAGYLEDKGYDLNNVIMYSWGAPRTITEALKGEFATRVPHGFSIAGKEDLAAHMPWRNFGTGPDYTHITKLVVLSSNIINRTGYPPGGPELYTTIGDTRVEHSNGRPFEGCSIVSLQGNYSVGVPFHSYGINLGHSQSQYMKRIENIVEGGIPGVGIFERSSGPLGGKRIWLSWNGGVQGPCDWVGLFHDASGSDLVGLLNYQWVVRGAGFPTGYGEWETFRNPFGSTDFWVGYVDGFGRVRRTKQLSGSSPDSPDGAGNTQGPRLSLSPPFPNPAQRAMIFQYATPGGTPIRLSVYDVAGRLVRDFDVGIPGMGEHSEHWDLRDASGRTVSTGLYFVKFVAGERSVVQKVIVTR